MKIVVIDYEILDSYGNIIAPEQLIDINARYWDIYCITEALLYQHIKRFDYEQRRYYEYYPYRKRFKAYYGNDSFTINLPTDINILRVIKANTENIE